MLKSLHIKNFRLFRDLNVEPLNRVNLIAGENNTGKTALLEALYLLFGGFDEFGGFPSALRSNFPISRDDPYNPWNEDEYESFWLWLSHRNKPEKLIEIEASGDREIPYAVKQKTGSEAGIVFEYPEDGRRIPYYKVSRETGPSASGGKDAHTKWPSVAVFSINLSNPIEDAEYFNSIDIKRGGGERVAELLRVIEPRLQKLKYSKPRGQRQPLVYADVGMEDLIPTTQLGQGFTRLLRLYSEILIAKSKIILIDEIENGIHYSAMPKVWKGIATIAREEDLQVFATTHSYECIRSAHEAFSSETPYDLALHRLERAGDDVKAVTYDKTTLETSIDMNLEVR